MMKRTKKTIIGGVKKAPPTTIYEFIQELQTWVNFSDLELRQAQKSLINTDTGPYFKSLVRDYKTGYYDEDIDLLGDCIKRMLSNTASYSKG